MIKKVRNIMPWTHVIEDLFGEEIVRTSYENKLLIKSGDKLYVKRKSYVNSFNNWIDKKNIV